MPNHVHLLIETPRPNLARGMQLLHGAYGRRFAGARGGPGHVFGGRYGSVRVRDDKQLWAAAAYVAVNPVTAGLCAAPEAWRWSSHRAVIADDAARASPWLDVARLLLLLSGSAGGDPRRVYAKYVAARLAVGSA
jgi:hypothetical protein